MSADLLFPAAICRGKVEHKDGTHFFGSLLGYSEHMSIAIRLGFVDSNGDVTALGRRVAKECVDIPHGRAVFYGEQYRSAAARAMGESQS